MKACVTVLLFLIGAGAPLSLGAGQKEWTANWVWIPKTPSPTASWSWIREIPPPAQNEWVYWRKTFDLPSLPAQALVHISADSRYRLYINGAYIGRGPARCDPKWQYYDTHEVASRLRQGKNVIAVLVHSYGVSTGQYMFSGGSGLLVETEVRLSPGRVMVVKTDESWRWRRAEAFRQDAPRVNDALGFVEIYDARKALVGWNQVNYDDSGWSRALVLKSGGGVATLPLAPWLNMVPRDIPYLLEAEMTAARVLQSGEVENYEAGAVDIAQQMAFEKYLPLHETRIEGTDAILAPDGKSVTVRTPIRSGTRSAPDRSAFIVLDFGKEVTGYPRLHIAEGFPGGMIDVGVGEYLRDGQVGVDATGLHVNRYIMRAGPQTWEAQEIEGFRYMQLTFRNCERPVKIDAATVNFSTYPVQWRGRFKSSDERLNRIWSTSAYTVQLSMHDAYEDCPAREQRQFFDDSRMEALVNYAAFGDFKLIRKLLIQAAQSQFGDGMINQFHPAGDSLRGRKGDNEIDNGLFWAIQLWDYYLYSGDRVLLEKLYPALGRMIAWYRQFLDRNDVLGNTTEWVFIDWANVDRRGEVTALNGLFAGAVQSAARIAAALGDRSKAEEYTALVARVAAGVNRRMWDEKRGIYVDAVYNGRQSRRVSQQSNGAALLFDIAPPERRSRILDAILDEKRLKLNPDVGATIPWDMPFDEEKDVILASPYFMHYVLRGLAHAGAFDRAFPLLYRWDDMIRKGATTMWETWQGVESPYHGWGVSLCHGWSATPTYDLSTEVLGVMPLKPGFEEFRVEPKPGPLEWAEGVFPSVKGDIPVSWKKSPGSFLLHASVPQGSRAELAVPRVAGPKSQAYVDGRLVTDTQKPGDNYLRVQVGPGKHSLEVR